MTYIYDDGGRAAAGYKGTAGDCVCRAIAIATGKPYATVYQTINALAEAERPHRGKRSSARNGVRKATDKAYLHSLGWIWHPTMGIGTGCKVHLTDGELPMLGRVVVQVSKHLIAMIDGVLHDTSDPQWHTSYFVPGQPVRHAARCVYGYWTEPNGL